MSNSIIPEGFRDDVSSKASIEHKYKNLIINFFQNNGFGLVKTPLVEYLGDSQNDNVLKILVTNKEKKLNIREDITMQIARLSELRLFKKIKPLKLCYYGEVVRRKGTMLRPERQFLQIGAECIGEENFLADVEMMELAYNSLILVGIKDITIEISSRIFFDNFIHNIKNLSKINDIKRLIKLKDLEAILKIIDKKFHSYIKNLFLCTGVYKEKKNNLQNLGINKSSIHEIENIQNIIKYFSARNKNANIFLDLCEIDDKNYHSGVRFTFYAHNVRGEIAKGGRYFVNHSSKENFGTGFTCYMDTILRASSSKIIYRKIMVPFDVSKKKINLLINKGYSVFRNTNQINITKKIVKSYDCQFYLENNRIKRL